MHNGYVKIFRKFLDTCFFNNSNCVHLAIYCLLKCNRDEKTIIFNGKKMIIKPGEFITGVHKISIATGLSTQQIRTAKKTLENVGFLTSKATNKFSLFSIDNYSEYQDLSNKQTNKPITNQQQTNNKPVTTNKNNKNNKKTAVSNYNDNLSKLNDKKSTKAKDNANYAPIYIDIVNYFNDTCKKKLTITDDRKKIIKSNLDLGRKVDDIKKAISNFSKDTWTGRPQYMDLVYAIGKQKGKPDNFDRWLSYEPTYTGNQVDPSEYDEVQSEVFGDENNGK